MGRIQKILVPVDGSVNGCKAVDEAIFFAEKCKADLDFVNWSTEKFFSKAGSVILFLIT